MAAIPTLPGLTELVRSASRAADALGPWTALTPVYEDRVIVLAQGIEFHDEDMTRPDDFKTPDFLSQRLGSDFLVLSPNFYTYSSEAQHVNFMILRISRKDEFKLALETPGIHVVYCGHARHGQGPCFGDRPVPGDDWGDGADGTTGGLWRAGYPVIGLPVSEIREHGYTVKPVRGAEPKPALSDCHPDVRSAYYQLHRYTLEELDPGLFLFIEPECVAGETFWGYDAWGHSGERHLLLHCGWDTTATDPLDVGGTDLKCRVFCCIACSTFTHHYRIVRSLKKWKRQDDTHYAYWTTNVTASFLMTAFWLYHVLSYPKRNDWESWKPSLSYAVKRTNTDYINKHMPYYSVLK